MVLRVLEHGQAAYTLLNVNVPYLPDAELRGFQLTHQSSRVYHSRLDEGADPRGRPYYWIGGDAPTGVPEPGTDIGALAAGFVSITPLHLDLTAYRSLSYLNTWEWEDRTLAAHIPIPASEVAAGP